MGKISITALNIVKWTAVSLWLLLTMAAGFTFYERLSHPNYKSISDFDLKLYVTISIIVLSVYFGINKLTDKIKTMSENSSM